jgi:trigger factor
MNISKENIDDLNAVLTLELVQEDYDERVTTVLKDYKKKANIPGFRPGKVPFGMINKMYRKPVLVEEINKLVSESISKYLIDEKLNILGEPLPHEGDNKEIDWDTDTSFEFKFDLGIAPDFELKVTARDKIPSYTIKADKEVITKYIESYTQRFGENKSIDGPIEEKDVLTVAVEQLDENGEAKTDGIKAEETRIAIDVIKDDASKDMILKAKKGDVLTIDLKKAYPSDAEISSMLNIPKDDAVDLSGDFKITINDILRFSPAEVNQELFDKIYGEGNVKSEEEFKVKIGEEAAEGLKRDSEYKFKLDVRAALVKKFKSNLPDEFLKRWLFAINEGKFTMEDIEKDWDKFTEDLKWQLVKDKISTDNELKVEEADLKEAAIANARVQFSYYGMSNVPDEHLESFAQRTLEDREQARKLAEGAIENKIVDFVRENAKIDEKDISSEKFRKLLEQDK